MRMIQSTRKLTGRLVALFICAGLILCAVGQGTAEEAEPVTLQAEMQAYEAVLLDGQPYLQAGADGAGEAAFALRPNLWYGYELDGVYGFTRFCLTDLDADGMPEILLELANAEGYPFGYQLLRYEAGTVYGFGFVERAMLEITLEGDISASNGAFDSGWYTLRFAADQAESTEICRMQSTNGYEQYFIGDTEVTQQDYQAYLDQLEAKDHPVWLDLTEENVRYVVSQL